MNREDTIKWGKLTTNEIDKIKAFGFWNNLHWYQKLHLYILSTKSNNLKIYYSGEIIEFKNGKVIKITNDKPIRGKRATISMLDDFYGGNING